MRVTITYCPHHDMWEYLAWHDKSGSRWNMVPPDRFVKWPPPSRL